MFFNLPQLGYFMHVKNKYSKMQKKSNLVMICTCNFVTYYMFNVYRPQSRQSSARGTDGNTNHSNSVHTITTYVSSHRQFTTIIYLERYETVQIMVQSKMFSTQHFLLSTYIISCMKFNCISIYCV